MSYGSRHLGMISPFLPMSYDTIPSGIVVSEGIEGYLEDTNNGGSTKACRFSLERGSRVRKKIFGKVVIEESMKEDDSEVDLHAASITTDVLLRHCGSAIGFDPNEVALAVRSCFSSVQASIGTHKANGGFGVGISTPAADGKPKRHMRQIIVDPVRNGLGAQELAMTIKDAFKCD